LPPLPLDAEYTFTITTEPPLPPFAPGIPTAMRDAPMVWSPRLLKITRGPSETTAPCAWTTPEALKIK
jgi:hypothetical protein